MSARGAVGILQELCILLFFAFDLVGFFGISRSAGRALEVGAVALLGRLLEHFLLVIES